MFPELSVFDSDCKRQNAPIAGSVLEVIFVAVAASRTSIADLN